MAKKRMKRKKSTKSEKEASVVKGAMEYLVVPVNVSESPEALTNQLNALGADVWRIVYVSAAHAWLMRAV